MKRLGQVKENVKQNGASKPSLKQNNQISSGTSHHKAAVRINPTPNSSPPQKVTPSGGLHHFPISTGVKPPRHRSLLLAQSSIQQAPNLGDSTLRAALPASCPSKLMFHFLSIPAPSQLTPHCYTCILSFLLWLKIHNRTPTTLTIFRGTVQYIPTVVKSISRNFFI